MLCDKCFRNIKLKCLFFFKTITSNAIYYNKEQMITISETRTDNIQSWSMIDDNDGYGQFYDTETNKLFNSEINKNKYQPEDPYDEYLNRYEQKIYQQEMQMEDMYKNETIISSFMKDRVLFKDHPMLYIVQYILDSCNKYI